MSAQVCPWNKFDWGDVSGSPLFGPVSTEVSAPPLADILSMDREDFEKVRSSSINCTCWQHLWTFSAFMDVFAVPGRSIGLRELTNGVKKHWVWIASINS